MKKFLALYMAPSEVISEMMKKSTPEQQQEGMQQWMKWMQAHQDHLSDMGNPTGKNMRVNKSGVSAVRNEVCGYSLVEANSHEEAAKMFTDNPHLMVPDSYIEIVECLPVPSM